MFKFRLNWWILDFFVFEQTHATIYTVKIAYIIVFADNVKYPAWRH